MATVSRTKGATSQSETIRLVSSATGNGLTGVAFGDVTCYYWRQGDLNATQVSLSGLAANNSTWASGGWKEIDATNLPGVYRIDLPNAVYASGVDEVDVLVKGATNQIDAWRHIELWDVDTQDGVRFGMTALPNVIPQGNGGLPVVDASGYINGIAGTKNRLDDLNDVTAATVNAQCDTALADYDAPTKTEMDAGFAALNDLTAAQVNAEVDTALADYDGPTNAEMVARTKATADYFDPATDTVTLAATGLDNISAADPGGVATTFAQMLVQIWRWFYKKAEFDSNTGTWKTFADDGSTVRTTQTSTDSGGVETRNAAT